MLTIRVQILENAPTHEPPLVIALLLLIVIPRLLRFMAREPVEFGTWRFP